MANWSVDFKINAIKRYKLEVCEGTNMDDILANIVYTLLKYPSHEAYICPHIKWNRP
jgi:hypothetical protein